MRRGEYISFLREEFEKARIENFETFVSKLLPNINCKNKRDDLIAEAQVALTLSDYGFSVKMRESPDLELKMESHILYAEVKRFHKKKRDFDDERRMEEASRRGCLVKIGDPVEDSQHAWEQVLSVAKKKCDQYSLDAPLILIISSESRSIGYSHVMTAQNFINEQLCESSDSELDRLNGILFFAHASNLSKRRIVYFYRIYGHVFSLPESLIGILEEIRGRRVLPLYIDGIAQL